MALLGLVSLLVWGGGLRKSAALWLLWAIIAVQVLTWTLGYFHHPQWVADNPQVDRLAKLFIFIAVAWWLGGSTRNTLVVWSLGLLAFFVALFVQGGGLAEWQLGFQGYRVDFGIRNAQHAAMFFATGLLGLVAFVYRCVYSSADRLVVWRLAIWLLALAFCIAGLLVTQTRAIWLALAIALPLVAVIWMRFALRRHGVARVRRRMLMGGALLAVMVVAVSGLFHDTVGRRLEMQQPIIEKVLQGQFTEMPNTGAGVRIQTWYAATQWIAERPIVGWGAKGRSLAIDQTEWLPAQVKRDFGHLHNFFLEIWVAYGLLGLAVIGALAIWVGRATWLAWRGGVLPGDMALFATGFFVYWAIVNQFESYNSFWTGVYVHNLVLGGLVTHYWRWTLEQDSRASAA
ncbi:O-antigen ligase family protein [Modicisalibacter muralis]|nr:O-antigen ligase family protein [Halomonas muralis]